MKYLLDTNTISKLVRGDMTVMENLSDNADNELCLSVVSVGEISYGVNLKDDQKYQHVWHEFNNLIEEVFDDLIAIDRLVSEKYGKLKASLRKSGKPMSDNDLWIAATCIVKNMVLVTSDGDFKDIDGLLVEDWTNKL